MLANPASVECRQVAPHAIKQRHFPPTAPGTGCCPSSFERPPCLDNRCRKPPSIELASPGPLQHPRDVGRHRESNPGLRACLGWCLSAHGYCAAPPAVRHFCSKSPLSVILHQLFLFLFLYVFVGVIALCSPARDIK